MTAVRHRNRVQRHLYGQLGRSIQAQVLCYVWYWMPKGQLTRDGQRWIAKTDDDFMIDSVTAKQRTIRYAIAELKSSGLIETTRGPHPARRAPNSRYLRIGDALFEHLENVAAGETYDEAEVQALFSGAPKAARRLKSRTEERRVKAAPRAQLKRQTQPLQPGKTRRFHVQKTNNQAPNSPSIVFEKRARRKKSKKRFSKRIEFQEQLEISADLSATHSGFDAGCRARQPGCLAPPLDTPVRVGHLQRFFDGCISLGLSPKEVPRAAYLFALEYDPHEIARELGLETASPSPNLHVLGMCANLAAASFIRERDFKPTKMIGVKSPFDTDDDDAS